MQWATISSYRIEEDSFCRTAQWVKLLELSWKKLKLSFLFNCFCSLSLPSIASSSSAYAYIDIYRVIYAFIEWNDFLVISWLKFFSRLSKQIYTHWHTHTQAHTLTHKHTHSLHWFALATKFPISKQNQRVSRFHWALPSEREGERGGGRLPDLSNKKGH